MSLVHGVNTHLSTAPTQSGSGRVLIAQPNEDVRELLTEHCRRLGLETLSTGTDGIEGHDELPDVDLIIAEPASSEAKCLLRIHGAQASTIPLLFVSVYPPVGVLSSSAVAYVVLPCSRERFEAAVANALRVARRAFA